MKTIKLTSTQQALYAELQSGRKIEIVNGHHMSGGTYRFTDNGELVRYKTFWNLINRLVANTIYENTPSEFAKARYFA